MTLVVPDAAEPVLSAISGVVVPLPVPMVPSVEVNCAKVLAAVANTSIMMSMFFFISDCFILSLLKT